jgi:uncharacterized membrane protein YgcG
MNKRWIWLALVLLLVGLGAAPHPQDTITYERYDVDIDIQPDGSLLVAETYQIRFEGEFHTGFAEIPLGTVTDIVDVQVREGERAYVEGGSGPGTFTLSREPDVIYVEWEYEPTSGTAVRAFTVEYRVLGGLWIYPEGDVLAWTAVPQDRSGIPVEASRVTVHLPQPVSPADLTFRSVDLETHTELPDAQTVVFEALASLPDGVALQIQVSFPHGLTTAAVPEWQRQADEMGTVYRWKSLDVDLTIAPDGTLGVEEEQTLVVDKGYLYHGYRQIPWLYLDRVTGVAVWEGERAFKSSADPSEYCYVVEDNAGQGNWLDFDGTQVVIHEDRAGSTLVEWAFPALTAGDEATFKLRYTVLGAVRVLTDAQEIAWTAVFADRDVEVEAASVQLRLPPGVNADVVTVEGGTTAVQSDGTLRVTRNTPVPAGEAWSVRVRLPVNATTAEKPDWQYSLEQALEAGRARMEAERQAAVSRARWQLALGVLSCMIPIVGLLGVLAAWYLWGRDRPAPVVAQYLTEPPSDLPPGVVAYLVDEKPTTKGVLADLLNLATLGLISVDLRQADFTVALNWGQKVGDNEVVRVADGEEVSLEKHERTLFNILADAIQQTNQPTPFSRVQPTFTRALPTIYEQMGEATTRYFSMRPEKAQRRWQRIGISIVILAGVLGVVSLCAMASVGPVVCAPSVGLALVGLMLMGASRWMPQRTTAGVEEAERWRAFQRYLKNLKQYGGVKEAQEVLDRYFPYAVALDVEEIVLQQAEKMGAQVPIWMVPVAVNVGTAPATPRMPARRVPGVPAVAGGLHRAARVRPSLAQRPAGADLSLDGLAGGLGRSLDQASRSLGSLLDTAVGAAGTPPLGVKVEGAGKATQMAWKADSSTMDILGDILKIASSGGGGGGYGGRRSGSSGFRSHSWSSSSRRSGGFSRPSGGGGRRGFK